MRRVKEYTTSIIVLHWTHFIALAALIVTGLYIAVGGTMGLVRLIHFVFAYVLTIAFVIRTYLAFGSHVNPDWREMIPDKKSIKLIIPTLKHYVYNQNYRHVTDGYNPIQRVAYLAFFIMVLVQILTGFALYDGQFFGLAESRALFYPLTALLGGSLPAVRLVHYIITLAFIIFTGVHIYMAVWTDLYEKNDIFKSIFTGYKLRK